MSRNRGIFNLAANYEPQISAPLDARTVVDNKADLILPATWIKGGNTSYLFNGLLVAVVGDSTEENKGLYILLNAALYTSESSWYKIADIRDVEALNARIDNIEAGAGVIQVNTRAELPNVGSPSVLYIVKGENASYYWDETGSKYYCAGRDYREITVINGGNAVGIDGGEN